MTVSALAVAAAAAVAATLVTSGHSTWKTPADPGVAQAHLTARDFLLKAAKAAAAAPDTGTGAYWRQTVVGGYLYATGLNSHPYVTERDTGPSTLWWPASPQGKHVWYQSVNYISRLPTAGATEAWRADGSPPLQRQEGKAPDVTQPDALRIGSVSLTLAQLRALPTSPAALRQVILTDSQVRAGELVVQGGEMMMINLGCLFLIMTGPVPPAVRAAAFRLLATIPGIRLEGQVTDPLGRTGYAITTPFKYSGGAELDDGSQGYNQAVPVARERLIFTASGVLLADEDVAVEPTSTLADMDTGATSSGHGTPASGAIPGPLACPSKKVWGDFPELILNVCWYDPRKTPQAATLTLGLPILAVPAGTVTRYTAYLGTDLTNDTPSPPPASLPGIAWPPTSAMSPSIPGTRMRANSITA
jgi:hypothetical protein